MELNFPRRYSLPANKLPDFNGVVEVMADPYIDGYPFHFRVTDLGILEYAVTVSPGAISHLSADRLQLLAKQPDALIDRTAEADSPNNAAAEAARLKEIRDAIAELQRTHNLFAFPTTHTFCGVVMESHWYCEDVILTDHRGTGIPLNVEQRDKLLNEQLKINEVERLFTGNVAGVADVLSTDGVYIIRSANSVQDLETGRPVQWILRVEGNSITEAEGAPTPRETSTIEDRNQRIKRRQHEMRKEQSDKRIRQGETIIQGRTV